MKDLYRRLSLPVRASEREIREAVEKCSSDTLRNSAEEILLSGLRPAYDFAHSQLVMLGALRANLGIDNTELWAETDSSDFSSVTRSGVSQLEWLRRQVASTPSMPTDPDSKSKKTAEAWQVIGLALLVFVGFWIFTSIRNATSWESERELRAQVAQQVAQTRTGDADSVTDAKSASITKGVSKGYRLSSANEREDATPAPDSGVMYRVSKPKKTWPMLQITADSAGDDFFVKLLDAITQRDVAHLYVRDGEFAQIKLPPGIYTVRYASGAHWYGESRLFGENTVASEGLRPIELRVIQEADGIRLVGGELVLKKREDGNFPDQSIPVDNF